MNRDPAQEPDEPLEGVSSDFSWEDLLEPKADTVEAFTDTMANLEAHAELSHLRIVQYAFYDTETGAELKVRVDDVIDKSGEKTDGVLTLMMLDPSDGQFLYLDAGQQRTELSDAEISLLQYGDRILGGQPPEAAGWLRLSLMEAGTMDHAATPVVASHLLDTAYDPDALQVADRFTFEKYSASDGAILDGYWLSGNDKFIQNADGVRADLEVISTNGKTYQYLLHSKVGEHLSIGPTPSPGPEATEATINADRVAKWEQERRQGMLAVTDGKLRELTTQLQRFL